MPTSGTDPPAAEPVNSRECVHAFAECIRAQARGQRAAFETNADVLRRAMAAENAGAMTEGVEADGGLLVPDTEQAKHWLELSAQELSDAQYALGKLYLSQGNHEELLARGGFYADLYNSQFESTTEIA